MALKDIKESVRAFRAENPHHKLRSIATRLQLGGGNKVIFTWRCRPQRGRPHVVVLEHGTYSLEEKAAFYEWVRGLS
jgi:hypothetical protein